MSSGRRDAVGACGRRARAPRCRTRWTLRPVFALAVRTFGRRRSLRSTRARSCSRSSSAIACSSHLLSTSAVAQPSFIASSAIRRSCAVTPSRGVADHERDVGALDGALRAQRGVVLDGLGDLRLAAHAGGVDEDELRPSTSKRQVDRVARGARDVGDDHALVAERPVDQRRLADVRAPDHRQAHGRPRPPRARPRAAARRARSSRSPVPRPWAAETAIGSPRPRRWNSAASGTSCDGVDLVRREDHRQLRSGAAGRPSPRRRGARRPWRRRRAAPTCASASAARRLVADRARDRVGVGEVHAAGVDEREAAAVPVRRQLLAVARDARALVHDGLARAGQAVDQRGLADIGVADDRDLHASPTIRATTSSTRQARGVDLDRVGRRDHRRVVAVRVTRVALGEVVQRGCRGGRRALAPGRRGEPDLHARRPA